MRRLLDGRSLEDMAIERLKQFEADAIEKHPDGYGLGFSGGKDFFEDDPDMVERDTDGT